MAFEGTGIADSWPVAAPGIPYERVAGSFDMELLEAIGLVAIYERTPELEGSDAGFVVGSWGNPKEADMLAEGSGLEIREMGPGTS